MKGRKSLVGNIINVQKGKNALCSRILVFYWLRGCYTDIRVSVFQVSYSYNVYMTNSTLTIDDTMTSNKRFHLSTFPNSYRNYNTSIHTLVNYPAKISSTNFDRNINKFIYIYIYILQYTIYILHTYTVVPTL